MATQILRLNKAGQAIAWIDLETAACLYARDQVLWSIGAHSVRLHGGIQQYSGLQSVMDINSVIATDGLISNKDSQSPPLSNSALFARDANLCLYCGRKFERAQLTRDHILPKSQGGKDLWVNCVAACRPCNHYKGGRTPEQAGIKLIAVPFKPNRSEYLALANRHILADQMAFLTRSFSKHMRI